MQSCSSGSQLGKQRISVPSLRIEQLALGSSHTGFASLPEQNWMHTPTLVSGSTFQHIDETSQLSMPLTPEPSTMHSSPTDAGAGSSGEHRVAFQALPPSFAHGMHFSSTGQSCAQIS